MLRMIKTCSLLYVSDWGLRAILNPIPDYAYIRFDYARFLKRVSHNILDNAYVGDGIGAQLDLVYKQAGLRLSEFQALSRVWGHPERIIFCLREPAGFMASASRKFDSVPTQVLRANYIRILNSYFKIGGDVFEYGTSLSIPDYVSFLKPLVFEGKQLPEFHYRGKQNLESVTEAMWDAYYKVRELTTG